MLEREPVRATEPERVEIARVATLFRDTDQGVPVSRPALLGPHGEQISIPESLYRVLREAVDRLGKGESVSIVQMDEELTTQEAADLLNVSRPYLVRLLEQGKIPFYKAGTHRRIKRQDLLAYRTQRDQTRRNALRKMLNEAEDLGLYDNPIPAQA